MEEEVLETEVIKEIREDEFKVALEIFGMKSEKNTSTDEIDTIEKNAFEELYESVEKTVS